MSATSDDRRRLTGFGVALGGPYAFLPELARQAESHGFDAVWVSETGQESIVQATVCLTATSRIEVGTNITLAFPRSPTITAMQAWDLDELSGGRFIVGLGSQVKRIIEERFSAEFDQPAKRMAEYVQAMKRLDEATAKAFLKQIVRGMLYCHQNNLTHRDLKLENLLVFEENQKFYPKISNHLCLVFVVCQVFVRFLQ